MKKIIAFWLIGFLLSCNSKPNIVTGSPLPPFDMLLPDSTVLRTADLPSGNYTLFMYFRPDCIFCQQETNEIVKNAASLQNVQIIFLSPKSLPDIKQFANFYKLGSISNIKVASDSKLGFLHYFNPPGIPFMVVYDKENRFKEAYAGGVSVDSLKASLNL